jgi:ribosomal protein S18 acetylase RimI-like enzyme
MELSLRPALAEDAEAALPLLYSAGPEGFAFLFDAPGRDGLAFLRLAFARDAGFLGHGVFTAAVLDQRVVGVAAAYGGDGLTGLTGRAMPALLSFYRLGAPAVLWRLGLLSQIARAPPRDALFVNSLGVDPELQGRGVGTRILQHAIERARAEGRRCVCLDVATSNPRAQQLYERLGFEVVAERTPTGRIASLPPLRRMELSLSR